MAAFERSNIRFVSEQDGESEREYKHEVSAFLKKLGIPVRAYLCEISYTDHFEFSEYSIALCLAEVTEAKDEMLAGTSQLFHRMFGSHESLDILFVSEDMEYELSKVCKPFFETKGPDFVLTSSEGYGLEEPRNCFVLRFLKGDHPDGYLLVLVEPPLIGQHLGLSGQDVHELVLATRHAEYSLNPVNSWPAYVHVAIPVHCIRAETQFVSSESLKLIGWGEIYKKREDVPQ